jgi:hypothetical protein
VKVYSEEYSEKLSWSQEKEGVMGERAIVLTTVNHFMFFLDGIDMKRLPRNQRREPAIPTGLSKTFN